MKLKHIRFNKTMKNNRINTNNRISLRTKQNLLRYNSNQNIKSRKIYRLHLKNYSYNYSFKNKIKNNEKYLKKDKNINTTRKNKILMPRFNSNFTLKRRITLPESDLNNNNNNNNNNNKSIASYSGRNNSNNDLYKQKLLRQYLKNKNRNIKWIKKNKEIKNSNDKTPIYNTYIPGSGVGASNISTRRLKKKFAHLN